ncbi:hypothetical protein [Variovorax sp. RO1]|uniref:hypothetical protein n=1 Tax=Variovorax sp. RO1 TaxID=2066034 RepID=UPI00117EBB99|nr:hypothetical protein [Variovorax sp. RO1]
MAAVSSLVIAGVTVAAGAYSANQQAQAGKAASRAGRDSAAIAAQNAGAEAGALMYEAEEARRVAQVNAQKLQGQAREFRSSQQALVAASGFTYDSGTAQVLQEETDNLVAADALAMLHDGGQKYIAGKLGAENIIKGGTSNAMQQIKQGDAQGQALQAQAVGTLLSSAVSAAGKYNSGARTTTSSSSPQVAGWGDTFKWGRE